MIWLIGCNGMLGSEVVKQLTEKKLPFDLKKMSFYIIAVCITCLIVQLSLNFWIVRYCIAIIWSAVLYCVYKPIVKSYVSKYIK